MKSKSLKIIGGTLLAIGLVGGSSLLLSSFLSIPTDTSSDISEEVVFDISEVAQYSLIENATNHYLSASGNTQVDFVLDGTWYYDTYSANPEFEMNYGFNSPSTTFTNNYGDFYLAYFEDGFGIGSTVSQTAYSKFSLEFNNYSLGDTNTYCVGLDISSTGADVDFMLSDDLGHFENEFTFYHQEITYFVILPGESYRIDHVASTAACYIDAIYIYYF
jgi:hypothetical protein